ncbi:hypothetical protein EVAR_40738_1 [Eumeta japonica]|uniref:Uncharacterized protein n=1 Tax=Eumeta variegata TaxID=151549 RepID=A0A4C1X7A7_EUMVA|nr:hypothetical protein EVAR_40738_1 [Eumeta japonica]
MHPCLRLWTPFFITPDVNPRRVSRGRLGVHLDYFGKYWPRNQLKIKNATCSTYDLPDDVLNEVGKNNPKVTGDALALEASTSTSPDVITEDVDDIFDFEI